MATINIEIKRTQLRSFPTNLNTSDLMATTKIEIRWTQLGSVPMNVDTSNSMAATFVRPRNSCGLFGFGFGFLALALARAIWPLVICCLVWSRSHSTMFGLFFSLSLALVPITKYKDRAGSGKLCLYASYATKVAHGEIQLGNP